MNVVDLKGQRFGRWTALEYVGLDKHKRALWKCECDCGIIKNVASNNLRRGLTKSCGCYKSQASKERLETHGHSKTRLYRIWQAIKRRCYNDREIRFENYGGKGIAMTEEWKNDFQAFEEWSLNNGYQDHLTIDRIDLSRGYEPSNCRWATIECQANNKSNNVFVEIKGEIHTLGEWARISNLSYKTIHSRYQRGETGEQLIRSARIRKQP